MAINPNQTNQFDIYNQQPQVSANNQINSNVNNALQNLQPAQVNSITPQQNQQFIASPFTMRQRAKMGPLKTCKK